MSELIVQKVDMLSNRVKQSLSYYTKGQENQVLDLVGGKGLHVMLRVYMKINSYRKSIVTDEYIVISCHHSIVPNVYAAKKIRLKLIKCGLLKVVKEKYHVSYVVNTVLAD